MDAKIFSRKRLVIPAIRKNSRIENKTISMQDKNSFDNFEKNKFENKVKQRKISKRENNYKDSIIIRKFIKTFMVAIIAVCIANRIIATIKPVMNILCINMAKSIATQIANEQATVVMKSYQYDNLCSVIRDEQENIKMISMNIVAVNDITSGVALKIQEGLNNYQNGEFFIKLGTFTGSKILSGRGPDVPIKMSTVGNVETDLVSTFSQAGINQTLHRIYLNVICEVIILTPYDTIQEKITNQILLAEAVIVGEVPNTYYNLNTKDNNNLVEFME